MKLLKGLPVLRLLHPSPASAEEKSQREICEEIDDAEVEARTFLIYGLNEKAADTLKAIIGKYPNDPMTRSSRALLAGIPSLPPKY